MYAPSFFSLIKKVLMNTEFIEKVWAIAQSAAEQNGCTLYDVEFLGAGPQRILRVFIDKSDGVGIEQCESVSRALNLHLDVDDMIPGGSYNLEVSSPGLERRLKRKNHFEAALNKEVLIKTKVKDAANQRTFNGSLVSVSDVGIEVKVDGEVKAFAFDNIDKAKTVFKFEANKKPNKKR